MMYGYSPRKKGFTLIELLVVIVIIGILAASLLPRLKSLQAGARDAARIASLTHVANALSSYYFDFGSYPSSGFADVGNLTDLVPNYISELPLDPIPNFRMDHFENFVASSGNFVFMPDNGDTRGVMMLMAKMETQQRANFHFSGPFSGATLDPNDIDWFELESVLCRHALTLVGPGEATLAEPCEFEAHDALRYITVRHN